MAKCNKTLKKYNFWIQAVKRLYIQLKKVTKLQYYNIVL